MNVSRFLHNSPKGVTLTTPPWPYLITDDPVKVEGWEHDRKLWLSATDDMSAIFMIALMDEFGYKKVRLARAYSTAADIAHEITTGQLSWDAVKKELA